MNTEITAMFEELRKPFSFEDIRVKVQSVKKDSSPKVAKPVAYLDSRCARKRLDTVFGPHMWSDTYREIYEDFPFKSADGKPSGAVGKVLIGVNCTITITLPDGTKVVREEVGVPTDIEPIKGAYSDAIKRAFAALGNDHLYYLDLGWHPITDSKSKPFTDQILKRIKGIYDMQIKNRTANVEVAEEFFDDSPPQRNGNAHTRADQVAAKLGVLTGEDADEEMFSLERGR